MSSADARRRIRQVEIERWLQGRLAESIQVASERVRVDAPLATYGFDSLVGVMMLTEIEDRLGVVLDPDEIGPGMTLRDLASLVGRVEARPDEEESDVA